MSKLLALIEFDNGYVLTLTENKLPFSIGRSTNCALKVTSSFVSRTHCTIDMVEGQLFIIDNNSRNGTFVNNHFLRGDKLALDNPILLLFGGEYMLTVQPLDEKGDLIKSTATEIQTDEVHGICIVDICDSTEKSIEKVRRITQSMRIELLKKDRDKILMIKNTGDGYLVIYKDSQATVKAAERLLEFQFKHGEIYDFDLRVTLDAGLTIQTHDKDRLGIAINRAARLEKLQIPDFQHRGENFANLKTKNRCILTEDFRKQLSQNHKASCEHIGSCILKGFGDVLHDVYQFNI